MKNQLKLSNCFSSDKNVIELNTILTKSGVKKKISSRDSIVKQVTTIISILQSKPEIITKFSGYSDSEKLTLQTFFDIKTLPKTELKKLIDSIIVENDDFKHKQDGIEAFYHEIIGLEKYPNFKEIVKILHNYVLPDGRYINVVVVSDNHIGICIDKYAIFSEDITYVFKSYDNNQTFEYSYNYDEDGDDVGNVDDDFIFWVESLLNNGEIQQ